MASAAGDAAGGTQPRARGAVLLTAELSGGRTRIGRLRQSGSLKALFPRGGEGALDCVLLNTAGGLTGGDRMSVTAAAGAGAALVLSTQAAERAYRAPPGSEARAEVRLTVGSGGRIDWLPQETILFEGSRLVRRLEVDLEEGATVLVVEPLVFGRAAMGEDPRDLRLADRWDLRRCGRPVLSDRLRIAGDAAGTLDRAAAGGGGRATATILFAAPGAAASLPGLRAILAGTGAASAAEDDILLARVLAEGSLALRAALFPAIRHLTGAEVPKVWRL
jgi:urease accessory protein